MKSYYVSCDSKEDLLCAMNRLVEFAKFMAEEYEGENSERSRYIDEILSEYGISVEVKDV